MISRFAVRQAQARPFMLRAAMNRPSGLIPTSLIGNADASNEGELNITGSFADLASQTRTLPSAQPVTMRWPSLENALAVTVLPWGMTASWEPLSKSQSLAVSSTLPETSQRPSLPKTSVRMSNS